MSKLMQIDLAKMVRRSNRIKQTVYFSCVICDNRSDLKNAAVPGHGICEDIARDQLRKIGAARCPAKRAPGRGDEQDQINQRDGKIVEVEPGVPLEDRSDREKEMVARAQNRPVRNGEVLPRDKGEGERTDRAQRLSHEHDILARKAIGDVAGGKRQRHHRQRDHQPDKSQRRGRMGARVHFPFDRDDEHQPADDGNQIARGVKSEGLKTKRRVGIMFSRRALERSFGGGRALSARGFVGGLRRVRFFVRHCVGTRLRSHTRRR